VLPGVCLWLCSPARAAEEPAPELTEQELQTWLSADSSEADASSDAELGPPPLPPRRHGWVIEGSVGALGHLGNMRRVSPVAPWFRLQVGYEPLDWLMLFAQGDVSLSSTSLAKTPPAERGYALFGLGGGARIGWQPFSALGFFLQGDAGVASVTEDVLATYGYPDSDRLRPFAGGSLGIDWFQLSPHYALSLSGGARDYFQTFDRINGDKPPWVWFGSVAIRYVL
jgi:hypothetical protein